MDIYLVIITTILVLTQVVRIAQNTISLRRQNKLMKIQMDEFEDVSSADIQRRRDVDTLLLEFLKIKLYEDDEEDYK